MNDSIEFTPKEKYLISLYKDPANMFRRSVTSALSFAVPSVALVIYYMVSGDVTAGILGYGFLLFRLVYRLIILRRGLGTLRSILEKYEAKLQKKNEPA